MNRKLKKFVIHFSNLVSQRGKLIVMQNAKKKRNWHDTSMELNSKQGQ